MSEDRLIIEGNAFRFGDDVDTDQIIPARYLDTSDPDKLAEHCMEGADENFASKVKPMDIIVAGRNFGCGSSREHAPLSIKGAGIGAVIAESFARIFFRNAINIGLPILECKGLEIRTGDKVTVDLRKGIVENRTTGTKAEFSEFPEFLADIISQGGLMNRIKTLVE
ncbi:MAG: 3-isopropylmalate dehydratase small subunit [Elusimicrobiota bacterium]